MRKQFAVLGLGSFGRSVALTLESIGCDVIVVDKSQETIQEIADRVTYAITADITEKEALSALGTRNLEQLLELRRILKQGSWRLCFVKK